MSVRPVLFAAGGVLSALGAAFGCSPGTHYQIRGDAMWPTLREGMVAVVNPLAYTSVASVRRGDVVVHIRPEGGALLKRVVGIAGDRMRWDARRGGRCNRALHLTAGAV